MTISRIQLRRGTAAQWTTANPILDVAEVGYETDTKRRKTGDGLTAWNALTYDIDQATATGTYTPMAAGIPDLLGTTWKIPHKCGANLAPESSIEAAEISLAQGSQFLDIDVQQGVGGVFYNSHDSTWARVAGQLAGPTGTPTATTRTVAATTVAGLETLAFILPQPVLGGKIARPVTTETFLRRFNGRAVINVEAKVQGQMTALVALCDRLKVSKKHVVLMTSFTTDIAVAVAAGYRVGYIAASGTSLDAATPAGLGASDIHVPLTSTSQATVDAAHAAGLRCVTYAATTTRRFDRDAMAALGADGWTSEDWLYTNSTAPLMTALNADQGVILPGMLPSAAGVRPTFGTDGSLIYNDSVTTSYRGLLLGQYGPLPPTYTLDFVWQFDAAAAVTSHINFAVLGVDKQWSDAGALTGANGFRALADMSGTGGASTAKIQKTTDGVHGTSTGTTQQTTTTTAIAAGGQFLGRLTVNGPAGTVRYERKDATGKVSTDSGADLTLAKAVTLTGVTGLETGSYINWGRAGVAGRLVSLTVT